MKKVNKTGSKKRSMRSDEIEKKVKPRSTRNLCMLFMLPTASGSVSLSLVCRVKVFIKKIKIKKRKVLKVYKKKIIGKSMLLIC